MAEEKSEKPVKPKELKITPPSFEERLKAAQDRLKDDPAIQELIKRGKKVYINTDTMEVEIIPDDEG